MPRVRAVAAGKAALGMAAAVDDAIGDRVVAAVATRLADAPTHRELGAGWQIIDASHPLPSPGSERAGRAALALADACASDAAPLVVCLSGGASAMLAVPARGLTIEDKAAANAVLLQSGLDIAGINLVRRHLSAIKGGRLGARARRSITLAISDVSGAGVDEPAVIASGPTVGDSSRAADAHAVLVEHGLLARMPPRVTRHLSAAAARAGGGAPGDTAEDPVPPDDPRLRQAAYWIVASRHDAMHHAARAAARLGYEPHVVEAPLTGGARDAARGLIARAAEAPRPACVIASGETTVRVTGSGRGGRNQELALGALPRLAELGGCALASVNTDGIDGPTDAAGAIVDSSMWDRLGSDPQSRWRDALDRHDSYPLLDELQALIKTGLTGTNVGDLVVIVHGAPGLQARRG
jgi:glycerate-2-kinase